MKLYFFFGLFARETSPRMETVVHLSPVRLLATRFPRQHCLTAIGYTSAYSRAPTPTNLPPSLISKADFEITTTTRPNSRYSFSTSPTSSTRSVTILATSRFPPIARTFLERLDNPTPTLSIVSLSVRILLPSDSNSPRLLCLNTSARR